jgi:hypothetical protein
VPALNATFHREGAERAGARICLLRGGARAAHGCELADPRRGAKDRCRRRQAPGDPAQASGTMSAKVPSMKRRHSSELDRGFRVEPSLAFGRNPALLVVVSCGCLFRSARRVAPTKPHDRSENGINVWHQSAVSGKPSQPRCGPSYRRDTNLELGRAGG